MSEHTPGLWKYTRLDNGNFEVHAEWVAIAEVTNRDDRPEDEANAALIADAPRLQRMAEAGEALVEAARRASPEVPHRARGFEGQALYECDPEKCIAHQLDRAITKYEEASRAPEA